MLAGYKYKEVDKLRNQNVQCKKEDIMSEIITDTYSVWEEILSEKRLDAIIQWHLNASEKEVS